MGRVCLADGLFVSPVHFRLRFFPGSYPTFAQRHSVLEAPKTKPAYQHHYAAFHELFSTNPRTDQTPL